MRRNSLILQKKFSTRWRHLYISKSQGIVVTRLALGGITATAPRLSNSVRNPSLSKALSASRAAKSRSVRSGATPTLSCRCPGSRTKRTRLPSASTRATILAPRVHRSSDYEPAVPHHIRPESGDPGNPTAERRPIREVFEEECRAEEEELWAAAAEIAREEARAGEVRR